MKSKYLVRPDDFAIFEVDESNGCYRAMSNEPISNRPNAYNHFTYDNLTLGYGFFPIDEFEVVIYKQKSEEYHNYLTYKTRSDGHGGIMGDTTFDEYIEYKNMLNMIKGKSEPTLHKCLIAIPFDGSSYLIKSEHNYLEEFFDGASLDDNLTKYDNLPRIPGVYKCVIRLHSFTCNHPEDPVEGDYICEVLSYTSVEHIINF